MALSSGQVGQCYHAISYYEDRENVIGSALLFLALRAGYKAFARGLGDAERMISPQICHPRYQCRSHAEYISKYALPPYSENL